MRRMTYHALRWVPRDGARMFSWAPPTGLLSIYRFIWSVSGRDQIWLCVTTLLVVALAMAPLELQRRMTNEAIGGRNVRLLVGLGLLYLLTMLGQGGLKYVLNLRRGRVVEIVALELRRLVHAASLAGAARPDHDRGSLVAMASAGGGHCGLRR